MTLDRLVNKPDENLLALLVDIENAYHITIDVETTGLTPYHGSEICGVAFSFPYTTNNAYYVPVRHKIHRIDGYTPKGAPILVFDQEATEEWNLDMDNYKKIIESLKVNATQRGYNYKFDLAFLRNDGMELPMTIEDPMLMAYLCNENEKNFKLEYLASKYLGVDSTKNQKGLSRALEEHGLPKGEMYKLHPQIVAPYAMEDVKLTDKLFDFYLKHINVWDLGEIMNEYFELELVVHMMEYRGMTIDVDKLKKYKREAYFNARHIESVIRKQVGYDINLNSPKQTSAWLNIESSNMETIENVIMTSDDPVKVSNCKLLLEYKSWMKVYGTYYSKFEEMIDKNNMLHASFQVIGTVSGRLSCRAPNLQAIPRQSKKKAGIDMSHIYKVKDVFKAHDGNVILSSDMSQIELRLGAVRANVAELKKKLIAGVDVHAETGFQLGIPRSQAKTINFSIFYGIGADALSESLKIPRDEASKMLKKYHELHPEIRAYAHELEARARAHGYTRMFTGRVKRYPNKELAHKAISSDIQGGVGEMMRIAMIKLHRLGLSQYLCNQIHDDIILEIPRGEIDRVAELVGRVLTDFEIMEDVPMATDTKIGQNWGELVPYDEIKAGNRAI